jgi:hypothetical protein
MRTIPFFLFCCLSSIAQASLPLSTCPSPIAPLPQLPIPAVVPPPVATCSTPTPTTIAGFLPITFVNNTGLPASEIFIGVLVNSSTQYLSFSSAPNKGTISNFTASTYFSSTTYSKPLDFFELIAADTYTFYIPNDGNTGVTGSNTMLSSRILISVKNPLTYFIDYTGAILLPSEFDITNDNYYILNDKIEFDLGSNALNRLNLNLTGVDFFGFPLLVQANYKFLFGTAFSDACAITGMPSGTSLNDVFTQYETALTTIQPPFKAHWENLVAKYTNPPSGGGSLSKLRIYAPATAMGSTQTQTNPSAITFPTNYFLNTILSNAKCSWFNAVWSGETESGSQAFYSKMNPSPYLLLDATVDTSAYATGYEVNDRSFRFTISGGPDHGKVITFPLPTSSKAFFTGAVSDYEPAITSNASAKTVAQVFKVFATSIIGGFFPIDCPKQIPSPSIINQTYIQNNSSNYFLNNSILEGSLTGCDCESNIPWYDFYSRALLTIGTPNLFYTSAYSDFLGADGTIVIVNLDTDNADATITVDLNDLSTGINFPDPFSDTDTYTITVNIPALTTVEFSTTSTGPFGAIPATADGDAFFLKVTYNDPTAKYTGLSFVTQVAPLAQIFRPILPGGGVVTTTALTTTVNIGASP